MQRKGRVWLKFFLIFQFQKPIEGEGKARFPEYWDRVKPGRIIFEIDGVNDTIAKESFDRAASKLPIKTKIVKRNTNI